MNKQEKILKESSKKENCIVCGRKMVEVFDDIAKKYTGHLWRCEYCMKDNPDLVISIG